MARLDRYILTLTTLMLMAFAAGCSQQMGSPYQTPAEYTRDSIKAQQLTQQAVDVMADSPAKAEQLLHDALAADVYHGPAHNNLGVMYLQQGQLYEAANEFEWARKLMPGHPDPRMNLALTLERAGRVDEAFATYQAALEVYPGHIPTIQAVTQLQLRRNRTNEYTDEYLREIALRGETDEWRDWAQMQLSQRSGD